MKNLAVLLCFVFSGGFALAQNATVTGTISDPSGAVVANAAIEVKNPQTGQIYSSVSTATGNYTVTSVPVGTYEMSVTLSGFKTYNRQGLTFAAGQVARIDVTLEVGAITESVTVTAETSLLKTETPEISHNVTVSQMNTLPILALGGAQDNNTSGFRDPYALARMIPGITYSANTTMVVNGNPDDTVQFRVDGQTSQNTGFLRQYTAIGQPSTDAIQEVVVQTSNYSAEFGTAGGAVFNATTKSGTNNYHGSVYDYAANEILNARQPYTNLLSPTRRHNYGFTIGGPVRIPKVYNGTNKTFFFWAWERYREDITVRTSVATVPTPEYRAGNFNQVIIGSGVGGAPLPLRIGTANYLDPLGRGYNSGSIFDPNTTRNVICPPSGATCSANAAGSNIPTRDQFPGNIIPASLFDPVAVKVLALVPLPTGPNAAAGQIGNNYQNPYPSQTRSQIPSIKLDQSIGSKHRVSFYYQKTGLEAQYTQQNGNAEGLPSPVTASRGSFIYTNTYRLNWDYNVTPTTLLHVGFGWFHHDFNDRAPVIDYNAERELGLRGATLNRNFPNFNVGSSGVATGGMNNLGPFFSIQGTGGSERRPSGVVNLSQVRGNHSIKFGAEFRGERFPTTNFGASAGAYTFASNSTVQTALQAVVLSQGSTGFPFASFLMGNVTGYRLDVPASVHTGKKQWALFLQDTWKVTRKLTFDYGLRWDYGTYARERWGRNANFSLDTPNPSAGGHPGAQIFEATCNCRFADNYPYGIGPRLGLAYQWNDKTVIRAGFGVVYTGTGVVGGQTTATATSTTPGFGQYLGLLKDGMLPSVQPRFPVLEPSVGQAPGAVVAGPGLLDPNAGRPARQYQWSFGVQREINRDLVVEASYVANRGVWWSAAGLSGLNLTSVADLSRYGFTVGNPADATLLNRQLGQLTPAQQSTLASRGVFVPYSNFPSNQSVRQSLLPFPQYTSAFQGTLAPLGKTWYDSLQVNATKRFSHGLSLNANYTLSKNLDLMSSPDVFNRNLGKNLSANDIPQQFRLTAEYVVPSLRNSGIKGLSNRFVSYLLADWGVGAYLQYQSAPILSLPTSVSPNSLAINQWLGRLPGPAQWNGQSLWSTSWTDYDGKVHTDPIDINCHCYDPAKTIVLNPAAWTNVPDGQWANNFSSIREYRNIRQPNENLNFSRNFRIKEGIALNIRVEFQNAFNRTRLSIPGGNSQTAFTANPQTFPSGANRGLYSAGFGTLLPTSGTPGARSGLFVGRLTF